MGPAVGGAEHLLRGRGRGNEHRTFQQAGHSLVVHLTWAACLAGTSLVLAMKRL